jgi:hypothetical protein
MKREEARERERARARARAGRGEMSSKKKDESVDIGCVCARGGESERREKGSIVPLYRHPTEGLCPFQALYRYATLSSLYYLSPTYIYRHAIKALLPVANILSPKYRQADR